MLKIVVTGSKGQLGSEIARMSADFPNFQFVFADIEELDLTDGVAVERFMTQNSPDVVINCAAYTAVDKAETDQEKATAINVTAVENLSRNSLKMNYFLVQISTDYVFNGHAFSPMDETYPMAPESVYGLTKAGGEIQMNNICPHGAIIRTAWLYSIFGNNFVKTMRKLGNAKEQISVVADQIGTPTCTSTLARFILQYLPQMIEKQGVETYHLTDSGVASWYDFASAIMRMSRLSCQVHPITSTEYPTPAPRPSFSLLSKQKLKNYFNFVPPHWTTPLQQCINELDEIENQ